MPGTGMTRKSSFVHFAGLDDDEEGDETKKPGGFFARAFGDHRGEREDAKEETEAYSPSHARTGSITTSVPVAENEEETHWFLSIGVDTRLAAARVMESRLAAAKVEHKDGVEGLPSTGGGGQGCIYVPDGQGLGLVERRLELFLGLLTFLLTRSP